MRSQGAHGGGLPNHTNGDRRTVSFEGSGFLDRLLSGFFVQDLRELLQASDDLGCL